MDRAHQESKKLEFQEPEARTPESQTPEVQDPAHESDVQSYEAEDPEAHDPTRDPKDPEPQRLKEMESSVHGREETEMEIAVEEHRYCYCRFDGVVEDAPTLVFLC